MIKLVRFNPAEQRILGGKDMSKEDYRQGFYDCKAMILGIIKGTADALFPNLPQAESPFLQMIESLELKEKEVEQ